MLPSWRLHCCLLLTFNPTATPPILDHDQFSGTPCPLVLRQGNRTRLRELSRTFLLGSLVGSVTEKYVNEREGRASDLSRTTVK